MNRRAMTVNVITDNSIQVIWTLKDGYVKGSIPFHHRRRFANGTVYTGLVYK
jgi:hypothetical protein